MKKALVLAVGMVLFLGALATAGTEYQTQVIASGVLNFTQLGHYDVGFINTIRIGSGILNFNQDILTSYGKFDNYVRVRATNIKFDNSAGESYVPGYSYDYVGDGIGSVWHPAHRQVGFNQQLYVGDVFWVGDGATSNQKFYAMNGTNYIAQTVNVDSQPGHGPIPPDTEPDMLNMFYSGKGQGGVMNNTFLYSLAGGRAMLQQIGYASSDAMTIGQFSNIGGLSSTWITKNDASWANFTQSLLWK